MANTTPNMGLRQPEGTDSADVPSDLAQITDALDALVTVNAGRGAYSARPAAGVDGRLYYATDRLMILRDNGATWDVVGWSPKTSVVGGVDGDIAYIVLSGGQVWHLYRRSSVWRYMGGAPLTTRITNAGAIPTSLYQLSATQINIPYAGRYRVEWGFTAADYAAAGAEWVEISVYTGGAVLSPTTLRVVGVTSSGINYWSRHAVQELDLAAGSMTLAIRASNTQWTLADAHLSVIPVFLAA